ncbi:MAG: sulfate adenylyltransferase, large subunit [Oscillospiraceae bacterium]|nr:sulfate adenylyltransferase, large subunit [Oscillospiraceae bacterium]
MSKNRDIMKIVVVGHVDHGKSSLIGRLLYDTNSLPEGTINKVKRIAKETGKPFEYAYLLDAFEEEQKQGITIDTTQIQFQSQIRDYVIIDAPGHKEFLKNMISGAANAEAALLIIDAKESVQEQSKRHAYILYLLGIKKVFVVLNKMDLVDYSEEVFNQVTLEMGEFLKTLGVSPLGYIPVSAFYGQNILKNSEFMSWYQGKNILSSMDSIEKERGVEEKPLRFPIQDVYKFDDRRIIAGRIEQGKLHVGDKIKIYPEGKETTVKSIEYWADRDQKSQIAAGESVGITVSDEFFNKRGEIITSGSDVPYVSNSFRANLFWMGKSPLIKGKTYKIKLTTQETEGELFEVIKTMDSSNLDCAGETAEVKINEVAEIIIKTKDLVAFDSFNDSQTTGRFVIVDGYDVAGGGIIVSDEAVVHNHFQAVFEYNGLKARGDIFEEYLYNSDTFNIEKKQNYLPVYTLGDEIEVKGESFSYPSNFDVLILRDNTAIRVRNQKITSITQLSDYKHEGYPVLNGRGFEINVKSDEEVQSFLRDWKVLSSTELLSKWVVFGKYRSIQFA